MASAVISKSRRRFQNADNSTFNGWFNSVIAMLVILTGYWFMKEAQCCDNEVFNLAKMQKKINPMYYVHTITSLEPTCWKWKWMAPSCDLASFLLVRTPRLPSKTKLLARAKIFIVAIMYKPRKGNQCSWENSLPVVFFLSPWII